MPKILLLLLIFLSLSTCNKNIPTSKSSAEPGFVVFNIDEKLEQELRAKNVFGPLSPVPLNRLRLVRVKHIGFDDQEPEPKKEGEFLAGMVWEGCLCLSSQREERERELNM